MKGSDTVVIRIVSATLTRSISVTFTTYHIGLTLYWIVPTQLFIAYQHSDERRHIGAITYPDVYLDIEGLARIQNPSLNVFKDWFWQKNT